MQIRAAGTEDAAACAEIYAPYVTDTVISFEAEPPDATAMADRIATALADHAWLVAVEEDRIVGYAYAGPWRSRPAYRHSCEVSVYVARGHGGRGIGRALYADLLPRLTSQGFHTALAGMALPNPGSIALHRGFGFREVGVFAEVGHKAGDWHDVAWMQLMLISS